jgi:hypothetical protein
MTSIVHKADLPSRCTPNGHCCREKYTFLAKRVPYTELDSCRECAAAWLSSSDLTRRSEKGTCFLEQTIRTIM